MNTNATYNPAAVINRTTLAPAFASKRATVATPAAIVEYATAAKRDVCVVCGCDCSETSGAPAFKTEVINRGLRNGYICVTCASAYSVSQAAAAALNKQANKHTIKHCSFVFAFDTANVTPRAKLELAQVHKASDSYTPYKRGACLYGYLSPVYNSRRFHGKLSSIETLTQAGALDIKRVTMSVSCSGLTPAAVELFATVNDTAIICKDNALLLVFPFTGYSDIMRYAAELEHIVIALHNKVVCNWDNEKQAAAHDSMTAYRLHKCKSVLKQAHKAGY